ncbi:uncharacterized protein BDR25DRAFT_352222 [Lindgomyces ingoldianus]|uniref:Uncharacterized protein n=1 Tax=Lindgomyces ingoldianus TaxID=673940 RepID=A0ACB6R5X9_9PLEO|nr:uncharacterized protein BDR25DRAFT_352222 [Lindgomyces ingoldianus]KAF2473720.1 hypothetical protein BDR25DRAFT_352222 [Lindgomyces ingoldianus]
MEISCLHQYVQIEETLNYDEKNEEPTDTSKNTYVPKTCQIQTSGVICKTPLAHGIQRMIFSRLRRASPPKPFRATLIVFKLFVGPETGTCVNVVYFHAGARGADRQLKRAGKQEDFWTSDFEHPPVAKEGKDVLYSTNNSPWRPESSNHFDFYLPGLLIVTMMKGSEKTSQTYTFLVPWGSKSIWKGPDIHQGYFEMLSLQSEALKRFPPLRYFSYATRCFISRCGTGTTPSYQEHFSARFKSTAEFRITIN